MKLCLFEAPLHTKLAHQYSSQHKTKSAGDQHSDIAKVTASKQQSSVASPHDDKHTEHGGDPRTAKPRVESTTQAHGYTSHVVDDRSHSNKHPSSTKLSQSSHTHVYTRRSACSKTGKTKLVPKSSDNTSSKPPTTRTPTDNKSSKSPTTRTPSDNKSSKPPTTSVTV